MTGIKRKSDLDFDGVTKAKNLKAGDPGSNDAARVVDVETASTADRSRVNHTGTQTASTISDFPETVRQNRITQLAPPTAGGADPLNLNGNEVSNVKAATSDGSAITLGQAKELISGVRKDEVRVVQSATNATLSGTPTIDGVATAVGNRVLVVGNGAANGIYVVASGAWSRAVDADTAGEFSSQWLVPVREGTSKGDHLYQHTTDGTITLGTTVLTFNDIGPLSAAAVTGYAANCPSVAAGATWTVNHALGTEDVIVVVRRVAAPKDAVEVWWGISDANNVSIQPDVALASGEFRAMVQKVV